MAHPALARFWELHSRDVIFFGGLIVVGVCVAVSAVLALVAGYVFCVVAVLMVWQQELAPFSWFDSDTPKLLMVLFSPLTVAGILIGLAVCVILAPFLLRRKIRRSHERDETNPDFNNWSWVIGGCLYYIALAIAIALMATSIGS